MGCGCSCGSDSKTNLIYACSGVANTGYLADQVARTLFADNFGSMTCLAAIGAGLSGFIFSAQAADKNIVIDGCSVGCGSKIFKEKGLHFDHYTTTDFGITKGKTAITQDIIDEVAGTIAQRI